MIRRNKGEITHGELLDAARDVHGVDPDDYVDGGFEALREAMSGEISTCKWCGAEFVHGWSDGFCTDQCEVDYIKEYHR